MIEVWKDVVGFEGLYQVSNKGEIKSIKRTIKMKLKTDKDGYKRIGLYKNGIKKYKQVHRLVAEAFIPNLNNLPCVNHKNEIKNDNRVENLEWCNVSYNNKYGNRLNKLKQKGKKVVQKTKDNKFIKIYKNVAQASLETKTCRSSIICCCNKKPHFLTANGYKWEYLKEGD